MHKQSNHSAYERLEAGTHVEHVVVSVYADVYEYSSSHVSAELSSTSHDTSTYVESSLAFWSAVLPKYIAVLDPSRHPQSSPQRRAQSGKTSHILLRNYLAYPHTRPPHKGRTRAARRPNSSSTTSSYDSSENVQAQQKL